MCKKVISLISFVLVACLVLPSVAAGDPNLVGWWKFDGNADDSSSYERHGSLQGNAGFAAGVDGQALELGGSADYVNIDGYQGITGRHAFSISAWVNWTGSGNSQIVAWGTQGSGTEANFLINKNNRLQLSTWAGNARTADDTVFTGQWYHVAVTVEPNVGGTDGAILYIDGLDATSASVITSLDIEPYTEVGIGWNPTRQSGYFNGLIDDVRLYDDVLTPAEVAELATRTKAYAPEPADGTLYDDTSVQLEWSPGDYADKHDVYFDTDESKVTAANRGIPLGVLVKQDHDSNSYSATPPLLVQGTTYYWRIDDVNVSDPSIWPGNVWSFTVPPDKAWDESPADNATFISPNVDLSWTRGLGALEHDVYFGTNYTEVDNGTGDTYKGTLFDPNTTYDPGPLAYDTEHYWRIDEYDGGTTHKGDVWTFETGSYIPITADANLVGWWKLDDDDSGTSEIDYSGYDHYGTVHGGPYYVAGADGNALDFDGGGDYVAMDQDNYKGIIGTHAFSITAWIKTTAAGTGTIASWGTSGAGTGARADFRVNTDRLRIEHGNGNVQSDANVNDGLWHHVAVTVIKGATASYPDVILYLDGWDDTISSTDTDAFNIIADANVNIGCRSTHGDRFFDGLIDDVRIYDRVLSPAEVRQHAGYNLDLAWNPDPGDNTTAVFPDANLSWSPGDNADKHDVYLGIDETAVTDANRDNELGVLVSKNQEPNSYNPDLELRETYFWRIDEVNDPCIWPGQVWNFTVRNWINVEDFEDYNDDTNEIHNTWSDYRSNPTGAAVYRETDIAQGGSQSMLLDYDNLNYGYSETYRSYDEDQDWTQGGAKALRLSYYGDPNSTIAEDETLYVVLEDGDSEHMCFCEREPNLLRASWRNCNIALEDFTNVDMNSIRQVSIGIGVRGASSGTGQGDVYIDTIRLYPPRCLNWDGFSPSGDFVGWDSGCVVDNAELEIMSDDWLISDYNVIAVAPSDDNLEAHYKFEENLEDSSVNNRDADPCDPNTTLTYVAGADGNAVSLDGTNYVTYSFEEQTFAAHTVALWVKTDTLGQDIQKSVFSGHSDWHFGFQIDVDGTNPGNYRYNDGVNQLIGPVDTDWIHLAATCNGTRTNLYYNGTLVSNTGAADDDMVFDKFAIGVNRAHGGENPRMFAGEIDDVRIYSRVLSPAEILYLAKGPGSEVYQPLSLSTNNDTDLYDDETINFKDFAKLADAWLKNQLWPE